MLELQSRVIREKNHDCVTAEDLLPGDFQKYINNNSIICLKDLKITEKTETFLHYTYKKSNNRLMFADLQCVGYHLSDPKVATQTIVEKKVTNQRCW